MTIMKKQMKTIILLLILCAVQLNSQFTLYTPDNSDLPNTKIEAIKVDLENRIWVGTDSGLVEINKGVWKVHNTNNSKLSKNDIKDLSIDNSKQLWVLLDSSIYKYENNEFELVNSEKGGEVFAVDGNGDVWLAYDRSYDLYKYENGKWNLKVEETNVNGQPIYNITIDKNNSVWIDRALYNGVHCFKNDSLYFYELNNTGINFSNPNSITVDSINNVWFSDSEAFIKFDQSLNKWTRYGKEFSENIIEFSRFSAIQFNKYNSPYLISRHSRPNAKPSYIHIMKDNTLESFQLDSFFIEGLYRVNNISPMAIDLYNNVWIHISDVGLLKFDPSISSVNLLPNSKYTIYPNPTTSSLIIELKNEALATSYKIADTKGKQLLIGSLSPSSFVNIDVEQLPAGVYIIELTTSSGELIIDKFVKR
jgi:ligand-binding sensor domain-containing protein